MATVELSPTTEHTEYLALDEQEGHGVLQVMGNVVNFARQHLRFLNAEPSDCLSEHFGHAEKRNDPFPDIANYTL